MRSQHYVYLFAAIPLLFPTLPAYGQDEAAPAVQCIEEGEGYLHVTLTGALNMRVPPTARHPGRPRDSPAAIRRGIDSVPGHRRRVRQVIRLAGGTR